MVAVLDWLGQEAQGFASPFEDLIQTDIVNPAREEMARVTGNQQAYQNARAEQRQLLQPRRLASNIAQVGLDIAAPGIAGAAGRAVEGALPAATSLGGKIAAGAAKGAVEGAAVGGPQGVAQGVGTNQPLSAKNLTLDFLQGAKGGAEFGSAVGGAVPAVGAAITNRTPLNQVGAVGKDVSNIVDDATASKLAKSADPAEIQKTLEPITGPAVAKDTADAISRTNDPNVVKNIVKNDLTKKLPIPSGAPTPEEQSLFATAPNGEQESLFQSGNQLSPQDINKEPTTQPAPATQRPFLNAPGEEPQTSHVTSAAALQGAQDVFNSGGTVDEALNHYMQQTDANIGEAKDALSKLIGNADPQLLQKGNINAKLNPRFTEGSKIVSDVQAGDHERAIKNSQTVYNSVVRAGNQALAEIDKLSPHDLQLMDRLRSTTPKELANEAQDKAQFLKAANATKAANDLNQGIGSGLLGQDVPYRQNYGAPLLLDNSQEGQAATQAAIAKLKTSPGYSKGRFFKDYDEAQSFGAKRQFGDFRDDFAYDMSRRAHDLAGLTLNKGLEEAYPGQVKNGVIGATPEGTYRQLGIPGGSRISLPKAIADEINKRAPAPDATGMLKGYDTLNAGLKNIKLAGGGFHSINVAGSFIGHQLLSGKAFTDPGASVDVFKATFSDKAMQSLTKTMDDQGYLRAFDQFGLKYGPGETAADVEAKGKLANIPILKQMHQAVFDRQIPYMKMRIMQQKMDAAGIKPGDMSPEQLQQGAKIAKELNQAFGGMNRAIQGLTPSQFKVVSRGLLATDYTEGQLRTLIDAVKKGGLDGNLARQIVMGKALLFAGLATAAGAAGGEFKGKNPQQIAGDILHKLINPEFQMGGYTVALPETQLSEFTKPEASAVSNAMNGKKWQTPIENFAKARLAALPSETFQLANNKDFYGNPMFGSDYYGRPISAASAATNIASGFTPVPVNQAIQAAKGEESPAAAVSNVAGLRATPTYDLSYAPIAGQTYVEQLKQAGANQDQLTRDTQFYSLVGQLASARKQALNKAIADVSKKDAQAAQKDIASYNKKLAEKLQPWIQSGGPKYFDSVLMQQLQSAMISLGTVNKQARFSTKSNPTAYGLPVTAGSTNTQAVSSAKQGNKI